MLDTATQLIEEANKIVVIQGENPDGDSLGSSIALESILGNKGKDIVMYCAISMPKYLGYVRGWDRVVSDYPYDADLAIIVDTASEALLEKALSRPAVRSHLESHSVLVLDHHVAKDSASDSSQALPFKTIDLIDQTAVSAGKIVYDLARHNDWPIDSESAEAIYISIASDTLGLTTPAVTSEIFSAVAKLVELGANPSEVENRRRSFMKKPRDILQFKAELINRINYELDGKLATVHVTWSDIQNYSDRYNPSVLVLDEMRLVNDVEVACAIKTYPDGKLTGKLRTNLPVADKIAGYFGGGGHEYSAGFKVYDDYDKILLELTQATEKVLEVINQ